MKFINYLESITGVGIYPLASFLIFFIVFSLATLYVFRADKQHLAHLSNIPLDK
jgi:cytochrome c oxidase cbb3-type subunit 4